MQARIAKTASVLAAVGLLLASHGALAVEKCSAKASTTNGVITVSASPVTPAVLWGDRPDAITKTFANAATCVEGGKAKSCTLGATSPVADREAITPPDLCTIWVDDGSGPCAAFVKGCTPGARAALGHPNGAGSSPSGQGRDCFYGEVYLSAGFRAGGTVAAGQILNISSNTALFQQIGNRFGGDPNQGTFALPDLRDAAPDGLVYAICVQGIFPPSPN
jgi:hypothetical protein